MKQFGKYWKHLACVLLCLSCIIPARAAQLIDVSKMGNVIVNNYPVEGAVISFFKVANVKADGSYEWLPEFEEIRLKTTNGKVTDDNVDAETLALYAETTDSLQPVTQVQIKDDVASAFLPVGLYVMSSRPVRMEEEKVVYHFTPTMVAVPRLDDGVPQYDYQINAKFRMDEIPEHPNMIHCTVVKAWEDSGVRLRPDEVVIDVYKDYEIEYSKKLNDENNWGFDFDNPDDGGILYFIEKNVANGYRYRVEEEIEGDQYTYTVVNTFDEDLYDPGKGDPNQDAEPTPTPTPPVKPTPTPTPPGGGPGGGGGNTTPRTSDETNMTLPVIGLVAGGVAAIVIALRLRGSKDE